MSTLTDKRIFDIRLSIRREPDKTLWGSISVAEKGGGTSGCAGSFDSAVRVGQVIKNMMIRKISL